MSSSDPQPGGLEAEAAAAGMSLRDYLRAFRQKWEAEHPEEVEAERLKKENARLQYELAEVKQREFEAVRTREGNREATIGIVVYFGGGFLIWLLFGSACTSCAWNGAPAASWWDFFAMFAYLGWGLGGIGAGYSVARWFR